VAVIIMSPTGLPDALLPGDALPALAAGLEPAPPLDELHAASTAQSAVPVIATAVRFKALLLSRVGRLLHGCLWLHHRQPDCRHGAAVSGSAERGEEPPVAVEPPMDRSELAGAPHQA
jgi:hypothetical protein